MSTVSSVLTNDRPFAAIARTISDLLSPPIMAIPGLALGVWASNAAGTYRYALLYFAMGVLAPVFYVLWLVKSGRVADFHLPNRRERVKPFAASLLFGVAGVALLVYLEAPAAFVGPLLALLLQTLVLFAITLAWQINIHTATVAGLVTFAVLAIGPFAWLLSLLVPLVAWARVYLGRHTVAQTLAGTAVGCMSFVALFALRGLIW